MAMSIGNIANALRRLGTCIMGVGLIALGICCVIDPIAASKLYGLPIGSSGNSDWVLVAGLRDFGLGVSTLALHVAHPAAIRVLAPSLLLIPLGDAGLTFQLGGTAMDAGAHIFGSFAIAILTVCAWLDPALDGYTGCSSKEK